jgi:hypothetical protein
MKSQKQIVERIYQRQIELAMKLKIGDQRQAEVIQAQLNELEWLLR